MLFGGSIFAAGITIMHSVVALRFRPRHGHIAPRYQSNGEHSNRDQKADQGRG
jgi:hypothetical protein